MVKLGCDTQVSRPGFIIGLFICFNREPLLGRQLSPTLSETESPPRKRIGVIETVQQDNRGTHGSKR